MNHQNANTSRSDYATSDKFDTAICSRRPASTEVLEFANSLAARAQGLSDDVYQKLHSVMNESPPASTGIGVTREVYPPLFDSLRDQLVKIDGALDAIQDALSRTEL